MKDGYDTSLIESCRNGERKAQKTVYDRLAPKMMALCLRYAGDRSVAQDLLQDGFVTLFTKIGDFKNEGSFEGWARRIFVTTCLMYLRKNDVLSNAEDIGNIYFDISGDNGGPLEDIGYKELMKVITELPTSFRTVFNMYAVEGYPHKDIARELGIPEATVRSQYSRAKAMIRQRLKSDKNGR